MTTHAGQPTDPKRTPDNISTAQQTTVASQAICRHCYQPGCSGVCIANVYAPAKDERARTIHDIAGDLERARSEVAAATKAREIASVAIKTGSEKIVSLRKEYDEESFRIKGGKRRAPKAPATGAADALTFTEIKK